VEIPQISIGGPNQVERAFNLRLQQKPGSQPGAIKSQRS
jgi:hypothetical protein